MAPTSSIPWHLRVPRIAWRGTLMVWVILGNLVEYLFAHALGRFARQPKTEILHKWSRWLLPRIGMTVAVEGEPPESGLMASNHLSYLDILVYSAVTPCSFVSKKEVLSWPCIGWVAALSGTVFIDRSRARQTREVQPQMERALANGGRLVLFPEGTSSDGSRILPFHSSLFQPAISLDTPITPAHISYWLADGDIATDVCFWGDMTLASHLKRFLSKKSVAVTVRFGAQPLRFEDRKEAARTIYAEVRRLAGSPIEDEEKDGEASEASACMAREVAPS